MEQAHELAFAAGKALHEHNYSNAEELYRQAIQLADKSPDPESPSELDVAHCLKSLAGILESQNKIEEAEQLKNRANQIAAKQLNEMDGFDR